jgi:hypothetical protein
LDTFAQAVCTSINPNIKHSPCHLDFNQDMIFHHAVKIDWDTVNQEHHKLVAASNQKESHSCLAKQYSPGDRILIILNSEECRSQPKMNAPTQGPFTITKVNANCTVEIRNVVETINILCIKPYNE